MTSAGRERFINAIDHSTNRWHASPSNTPGNDSRTTSANGQPPSLESTNPTPSSRATRPTGSEKCQAFESPTSTIAPAALSIVVVFTPKRGRFDSTKRRAADVAA